MERGRRQSRGEAIREEIRKLSLLVSHNLDTPPPRQPPHRELWFLLGMCVCCILLSSGRPLEYLLPELKLKIEKIVEEARRQQSRAAARRLIEEAKSVIAGFVYNVLEQVERVDSSTYSAITGIRSGLGVEDCRVLEHLAHVVRRLEETYRVLYTMLNSEEQQRDDDDNIEQIGEEHDSDSPSSIMESNQSRSDAVPIVKLGDDDAEYIIVRMLLAGDITLEEANITWDRFLTLVEKYYPELLDRVRERGTPHVSTYDELDMIEEEREREHRGRTEIVKELREQVSMRDGVIVEGNVDGALSWTCAILKLHDVRGDICKILHEESGHVAACMETDDGVLLMVPRAGKDINLDVALRGVRYSTYSWETALKDETVIKFLRWVTDVKAVTVPLSVLQQVLSRCSESSSDSSQARLDASRLGVQVADMQHS